MGIYLLTSVRNAIPTPMLNLITQLVEVSLIAEMEIMGTKQFGNAFPAQMGQFPTILFPSVSFKVNAPKVTLRIFGKKYVKNAA